MSGNHVGDFEKGMDDTAGAYFAMHESDFTITDWSIDDHLLAHGKPRKTEDLKVNYLDQ